MFNDSRLQNLQKDLENLHKSQAAIREDIAYLRKTMEAKVARIRSEYGDDIQSLERKYTTASNRIPDITRQIETRQRELDAELKRSAANTNSAPSSYSRRAA
jgi:peptidoglycan hydrolase CwlO-like protein